MTEWPTRQTVSDTGSLFVTFREAVAGHFAVMDSAAFSLCADNNLHIIVFNFSEDGALCKVLSGDYSVGTVVS